MMLSALDRLQINIHMTTNVTYRSIVEADASAMKQISDHMLMSTGLGCATEDKILRMMRSPNIAGFAAEVDGEIVGFVVGAVHENIFNDRRRVSDLVLFVEPTFRGLEISRGLITCLEKWAQERGAKEVWLGQTTAYRPEKTAKFYQRRGYKLAGFNAVKEI